MISRSGIIVSSPKCTIEMVMVFARFPSISRGLRKRKKKKLSLNNSCLSKIFQFLNVIHN